MKFKQKSEKRPWRMYFSREAERRFFFYSTLVMLAAGLVWRLF